MHSECRHLALGLHSRITLSVNNEPGEMTSAWDKRSMDRNKRRLHY